MTKIYGNGLTGLGGLGGGDLYVPTPPGDDHRPEPPPAPPPRPAVLHGHLNFAETVNSIYLGVL